MKSFFSNCNVAALRQLGGGRVLLDLCLSLPEFSKIISPQPSSSSSLMSLTSSRWALQLLFLSLFCYGLHVFTGEFIKPLPFVKCFSTHTILNLSDFLNTQPQAHFLNSFLLSLNNGLLYVQQIRSFILYSAFLTVFRGCLLSC